MKKIGEKTALYRGSCSTLRARHVKRGPLLHTLPRSGSVCARYRGVLRYRGARYRGVLL